MKTTVKKGQRENRARDTLNLITRDLFGLTRIIKCGTLVRKLTVRFISFIVYITSSLARNVKEIAVQRAIDIE